MKRVVVTGLAAVTPLGNSADDFWRALTAGRSGIGPITLFDASRFPVRIAGEVKDFCGEGLPAERDRKVKLGLAALDQAIADARLESADLSGAMLHVGVGLEAFFLEDMTAVAGEGNLGAALARALAADASRPTLQTPLNRLTQLGVRRHRIGGARFTNCSACAAGAQAIGQAYHALVDGMADVAIAGGADSMVNPLGLGGFSLLRILSTENDRPHHACRPFDATREGTVLGEGAAFVVLETLEHARRRGARAYARVLGYGSSMDAFRISDPDPTGQGAVLAMQAAIRDAQIDAAEIDCVNAHGTGTPKNDATETAAIKIVLGDRARRIPVHAVKSMTGHLIAASGAVEAVAAALTLHHRTVPPTINLDRKDPECDLDYVAHVARPFDGTAVLSNSFAFGGQNASLIFGRCRESGET